MVYIVQTIYSDNSDIFVIRIEQSLKKILTVS